MTTVWRFLCAVIGHKPRCDGWRPGAAREWTRYVECRRCGAFASDWARGSDRPPLDINRPKLRRLA